MTRRPPLLKSLLAFFAKRKDPDGPALPEKARRQENALARTRSSIETLEGRIAPASLLNSSTVQYQDADGDTVTVKFSTAVFKNASALVNLANVDLVFGFDQADPTHTNAVKQQLQLIDFTRFATFGIAANGLSVSITSTAAGGGNGFADVGAIKATGLRLGTVAVDGDLGQIDVGASNLVTALGSLTAESVGKRGTATQSAGGDLVSNILGGVGTLVVNDDFQDARFIVANGTAIVGGGTVVTAPGKIGSITIKGSLVGRTAVEAASNNTGSIEAASTIGTIKIGSGPGDGIFGGGGSTSGRINATGAITSVTINGSITGGAGESAGQIKTSATIGTVVVNGNIVGGGGVTSGQISASSAVGTITVNGNVTGGGGAGSGSIVSGTKITTLSVTGKLQGGTTDSAGLIQATGGFGTVKIGQDVVGGTGTNSGRIVSNGLISLLDIKGSVLGGDGGGSGFVTTTSGITTVKVGLDLKGGIGDSSGRIQASGAVTTATIGRDIVAGTGPNSGVLALGTTAGTVTVTGKLDGSTVNSGDTAGAIISQNITRLTIGSILGGSGAKTGFVETVLNAGSINVLGNIAGGAGASSGTILGHGKIASLTVGGNIQGGTGSLSGTVQSGFNPTLNGDIGAVIISGKLLGNTGDSSGSLISGGAIASVSVGSKTTTAADVLVGGDGLFSGGIFSEGAMRVVKISGGLLGGLGASSGSIAAADRVDATGVFEGDILSLSTTGAVKGGAGAKSGGIFATGDIRAATIGGLAGAAGASSGSIFADSDISALTIKGAVTGAKIRAGDTIGTVSITGNVAGTDITARGQAIQAKTADLAISRVTVTGNVSDTDILAGYDLSGAAVNADAQIGTVSVTGSWTASNIAAGIGEGGDSGFGNALDAVIATGGNDPLIVSRIASITIGGAVAGTAAAGDHFGFVAEQIGAVKLGTLVVPMVAATTGQVFEQSTPVIGGRLGSSGNDVSIREIL